MPPSDCILSWPISWNVPVLALQGCTAVLEELPGPCIAAAIPESSEGHLEQARLLRLPGLQQHLLGLLANPGREGSSRDATTTYIVAPLATLLSLPLNRTRSPERTLSGASPRWSNAWNLSYSMAGPDT